MKLFVKAVLCGFFLTCLLSMTGFCSVCENLQNDVFRLHILANSDTIQDQQLKLKVRDGLLDYTVQLFQNCRTRDEAVSAAKNNTDKLRDYAQELVRRNGYDYPVDAYVTSMSFDTRIYENFTMPAGTYETLRIVIGQGNGHNWWCVLYPALCIPAAQDNSLGTVLDSNEADVITNTDKYEVKFKFVEILQNICSFFQQ